VRANLPEDAPELPSNSPVLSEPSGRGSLDWFNDNTSHSGHEKNHLFVNNLGTRKGELFTDISGISGVNSPADARASVVLDFDRDGFSDLATVNANSPKLELWRNRYAELARDPEANAHFIALRFEGANRTSSPKKGASARDGFGAQVSARLGSGSKALTLRREHRAGEGFAAQNSSTMHIGLGTHTKVTQLEVRWPSGNISTLENVESGSLVTLVEGSKARTEGYALVMEQPPTDDVPLQNEKLSKLVMYTTMTTTCTNCIAELPELAHLRASFSPNNLSMVGLPMDDADSVDELRRYEQRFQPAYELRAELSSEEREATRKMVLEQLRIEATPTTIITDRHGKLLSIQLGAPTVSELKKLLAGS